MTPDASEPAPFGRISITCLDGEQNSFPALITSLGGGGILRVRVPRSLPEGTRVQVHAGLENSGTATVLYSVGANDQYWATIQIHRDDRRREPRIAVNTIARIVVFHSSLTIAADARVTDVSKSGLGLITDQPIPRDAMLKIVLDGAILFGEIRYCSEVGGSIRSYRIGVQIQTVILNGEADPDWQHTPAELWGSLALAVRTFQGRG
jgi:hypothetical protein